MGIDGNNHQSNHQNCPPIKSLHRPIKSQSNRQFFTTIAIKSNHQSNHVKDNFSDLIGDCKPPITNQIIQNPSETGLRSSLQVIMGYRFIFFDDLMIWLTYSNHNLNQLPQNGRWFDWWLDWREFCSIKSPITHLMIVNQFPIKKGVWLAIFSIIQSNRPQLWLIKRSTHDYLSFNCQRRRWQGILIKN